MLDLLTQQHTGREASALAEPNHDVEGLAPVVSDKFTNLSMRLGNFEVCWRVEPASVRSRVDIGDSRGWVAEDWSVGEIETVAWWEHGKERSNLCFQDGGISAHSMEAEDADCHCGFNGEFYDRERVVGFKVRAGLACQREKIKGGKRASFYALDCEITKITSCNINGAWICILLLHVDRVHSK